MIWVILSLIGLVVVAYKMKVNKKAIGRYLDLGGTTIQTLTTVCIFIGISAIQLGIGLHEYLSLSKERASISVLEKRVDDIKTAYYPCGNKGAFVTGSIENMSQSTNLSRFISDLAWKESEYSGKLKRAYLNKELFLLYFFSYGWAISDDIYKLEAIK